MKKIVSTTISLGVIDVFLFLIHIYTSFKINIVKLDFNIFLVLEYYKLFK